MCSLTLVFTTRGEDQGREGKEKEQTVKLHSGGHLLGLGNTIVIVLYLPPTHGLTDVPCLLVEG